MEPWSLTHDIEQARFRNGHGPQPGPFPEKPTTASLAVVLRVAADTVLLLHAAFILFVLFGAALAAWWRWIPLIHLPAAAWGVFVELTGRICPLTPLENSLRLQAGQTGYSTSFIEHYILDLIYPSGLTSSVQLALAGVVVITNIVIYGWLIQRRRRRRASAGVPP